MLKTGTSVFLGDEDMKLDTMAQQYNGVREGEKYEIFDSFYQQKVALSALTIEQTIPYH